MVVATTPKGKRRRYIIIKSYQSASLLSVCAVPDDIYAAQKAKLQYPNYCSL
jgi:hypothetical protein